MERRRLEQIDQCRDAAHEAMLKYAKFKEWGDPVMASFDGKPARALSACTQLRGDGKSPDAVLAVYNSHLARLIELQAAIGRGQSPADAVAALRPPVFFALKPVLIAQAQRWRDATVLTALAREAAETLERLRLPQVDAWSELERLLITTCAKA